tara:strand:+ start:388 stop:1293 length:906 start_codon:yes stop_codon:yes gene_type:complete
MGDVFPRGVAFINDGFVDISEAKISILDWGFLRSDATYDVVHVWEGRFFLLDKHIDRFFNSTKKLKMPCKTSKEELKKILATCVERSGLKNAYVEMIQTRGMSPTFDRDPRASIPNFMAFAIPFSWILRPEEINSGINVAITNVKRIPPNSIDPTIKNYHWLDLVRGMYEAFDMGCQTGLLVDEKNNVLEGPGFNVFALCEDTLISPPSGILEGITRWSVIEISKQLKIPFRLVSLSKKTLGFSKEVFITSTAGGVMPVTKINNKKIGSGSMGPVTKKIYDFYWKKHKDPVWSNSVKEFLK